jgi:plastocyanin
MNRRLAVLIICAGLSAISLSQATGAAGAGGTVEGTVKVSGVASNADAVVYIQQAPGPFTPAAKPAAMDQKNMQFVPRVLPVVVGTTVRFLNSDPTPHNVFSPDGEKYDLGTWPQGKTQDHVFAKCAKAPCVYVQLCRIHPEMEGYVIVLQNPLFAVTGSDGHYKIDSVPAGPVSVAVWHSKGKAQPKPATVDLSKPTVVDFVLGK